MKSLALFAGALALFDIASAVPVVAKRQYTPKWGGTKHLRPVIEKRQDQSELTFEDGAPSDGEGNGGPIIAGTNRVIDLQNPANLGQESTDEGLVQNLKWRMSDSRTSVLEGGWTRQQVITDLPPSTDIAGAQQHLQKGGIRELHWHRVAEWGYVYAGRITISAVDEEGRNQFETLEVGDIWYFPKGIAHSIQGLEDNNEYLLTFDDGDFSAQGTTFNVGDWINHTPKDILAKNFGVDASVFDEVPDPPVQIADGTPTLEGVESPYGALEGNMSFVYHASQVEPIIAPGGGGTIQKVDSSNFPIATTIAAAIVTVKPGGLREMHWHPNDQEWLFFLYGDARATVFMGTSDARTFDFGPGDTAVFPDNSGHYVENRSETEDLVWIEIYNSDRAIDISLSQWMALTPPEQVADTLNVPLSFVQSLKKEKQLILP